jgi:hypothetical protein
MVALFTEVFSGILIFAVVVIALSLAHKSQARIWRLLGWFACVWALTLILVEGYGWYRRGDWQIMTAYKFWSDVNRSSLLWLGNHLPSIIWSPIDFVLHFPAWLVMIVGGILLLAFDHRLLQRTKIGEKPPTLRKRLKDWFAKLQREEEEEA